MRTTFGEASGPINRLARIFLKGNDAGCAKDVSPAPAARLRVDRAIEVAVQLKELIARLVGQFQHGWVPLFHAGRGAWLHRRRVVSPGDGVPVRYCADLTLPVPAIPRL